MNDELFLAMEAAADAAGEPLALYCMKMLAKMHKVELKKADAAAQLPLAIGA